MNSSDREFQRRTRVRVLDNYQNPGLDPLQVDAGSPSRLAVTVTQTTYPTSTQRFHAVRMLYLAGQEVEGGAGVAVQGELFYALNLGGSVPPPGTQVVCVYVGNRWVFGYGA